ncbi:MAG TPA: 2-C-methyl-D-erythritol 4-phosphate cytidylyltransferase [Solirubrobacteraceae bacterium]|nr:2-C-methyl-D-erythritol 4-phosphate cytidylyltransferase [Solirubrobacteraceae bacterium]
MAVALIVAAGRGERLGSGGPKALVELAGRPLLAWSLDTILATPAIERVVVALPASDGEPPGTVVGLPGEVWAPSDEAVASLGGLAAADRLLGVVGGAVRSESVRLALAASGRGPASELVLVHDAARPLVSRELIEAVLDAAGPGGVDDADVAGGADLTGGAAAAGEAPAGGGVAGAIAAAPVTDTVKRVDADRLVRETLDRSQLWAVQTPQVFRRDALTRALDVPEEVLAEATDDAWLVERIGGRVRVVPAPRENLKVTTELDLHVAEMLLGRRPV